MEKLISRDELVGLVLKLLKEHFEESGEKVDLNEGEMTKLFGGDGLLNSLGLVSFIVALEESLEDEFGISVLLADEKAMSRRTSPFSRVSYLVDYIQELIK
jgi:D-alanine--poly(phosphoribitol) ligase subunit 2